MRKIREPNTDGIRYNDIGLHKESEDYLLGWVGTYRKESLKVKNYLEDPHACLSTT